MEQEEAIAGKVRELLGVSVELPAPGQVFQHFKGGLYAFLGYSFSTSLACIEVCSRPL